MSKDQEQSRINGDYFGLLSKYSSGIELSQLLILSQETIGFAPHRMAEPVEGRVEEFARKYGIWLADRGVHYNTMTAYLHPSTSDEERLYFLGAYYAVLFFIDDVMGNEFRPDMTEAEIAQADLEIEALLEFVYSNAIPKESTKLLPPIMEVLEGFWRLGDPKWVKYFMEFTRHHLELAVQDLDSSALGHTLPLEKYVAMRNHVSGMYPAILMMEFAENNYLPRPELKEANLLDDIVRLEYLCAAIGGLVNDFFSFEKEVIEAQSDFNLIPVMMMNENLSLEEAFKAAADYTNDLYQEYKTLAVQVREAAQPYSWGHIINRHIDAMDACNQAVWVWQIETERYRREDSLFAELRNTGPHYENLERMQWLTK